MHNLNANFDFSAPDWNNIAPVNVCQSARLTDDTHLYLDTDAGALQISLFDAGMRLRSADEAGPEYGLLVNEPEALTLTLAQTDKECVVTSGEWHLRVEFRPFAFELQRSSEVVARTPTDGHFVRRYRIPPLVRVPQGWLFSLDLTHDEAVYGLGEKWGKLDKRGQLLRSYNHDALGVNAEISYKNTPFAWSNRGWASFVHTPAPVTHSVGYAPWSNRSYSMLVEDDVLDVFLFQGTDGQTLIESYTALTGRSPTPPLWSLGVILSKAYYRDVPELLATAREVREKQMPCDVITLDGRAWQDTETRFAFEWDPSRFDDPAEVMEQLKAEDFKVCVWEYPLVSVHNPLFNEMAGKGWLLKHKLTGEPYRYQWDQSAFGEVLTPLPESGIVDFTHPEAYAFWRDSHKPLFDLGVDMIKADFGEQVEDDNMLAHNGDSGNRLHNVYSFLYNQCVYEAAERYSKTGAFLFSRSAWTGSQRFPSQWGGDPQADWGGLAGSIRGALSWGMSGAPFFATDVGGFYKDTRDAELFARWCQAAVFSAHMRLHGIGQREPWSYDDKAELAANKALAWRYRLLPYISQTVSQASESGLPVMRAMALAYPHERASWAFEHQFMFGDSLLVAPCLAPGGQVEVYLPQGDWLRLEDASSWQGGRVHALTLALDEVAVFAKAGSKIPLGPAIQHTNHLNGQAQIQGYWPDMPI